MLALSHTDSVHTRSSRFLFVLGCHQASCLSSLNNLYHSLFTSIISIKTLSEWLI